MDKQKINEYKKRARELVSQMTLEEKVGQMCNSAIAVERLGIQQYNWWNEALHGVARAGVATVFPQAIGLAATFDAPLMREIGDIVSTEGRAKHNAYKAEGDYGMYKGLTFWSPNINIFRDPRWGRGQETFGEDPFLTSELGVNYIKGLQGDDANHLKSAACVKHFVAHSGPEKTRHGFNSVVSAKDFYETYFPAFERCIKEGQVEGVMGAYSSVNDEICCASKWLISDLLRDKTGFDGYYVSDCGAIHDIHAAFHRAPTFLDAAVMAAKSGCDLNCGGVYQWLITAHKEGLISEDEIDECVTRLMTTRLKLGLIDGENCVYNSIDYSYNDSEYNHSICLKAAEESIVLLKNDGVLPINISKVKKVAVIGPNTNDVSVLLGNYNGTPSEYYTPLEGIRKVFGDGVKIMFSDGCPVSGNYINGEPKDRLAEAVFTAKMCDLAIVCVGINPRLEGEEGDAYNSDIAGDKPDLNLPGVQNELIEKVIATGVKTVVVNISGSAMDLSVACKANALIQQMYSGMYGGIALANVISGKCNPSGKLPVTFYNSVDDLPEFTDYSMQGRTYRYFNGEPQFEFGFGLSYTQFEYSQVIADRHIISDDDSVTITATVTNIGDVDGDEIVQLYVRAENPPFVCPKHQLKGIKRVTVKSGESKQVQFCLPADTFRLINDNGDSVLLNGAYSVYIGGGQPKAGQNGIKINIK